MHQLEATIEDLYNSFKAQNESKNIFKAARTPAVFLTVAICFYILSGIFGLFGMYTFANFSNLIMGIALLTLTLWAYVRYVFLADANAKMCNTRPATHPALGTFDFITDTAVI